MVVFLCNVIFIIMLIILILLVCSIKIKLVNLEIKDYESLNDIVKETIKKEYADILNYIDFTAKLQLCLFDKIPIISITITNLKLKSIIHKLIAKQMEKEVRLRQKLYKKFYKDNANMKNNKSSKSELKIENEMLQNEGVNQDARIEEYVKIRKDYEKLKQNEFVEKVLDKIRIEELELWLNLGTENASFTAILVSILNIAISVIFPLFIPIADGEKVKYQVTPIYLKEHAFNLKTSMQITIPII